MLDYGKSLADSGKSASGAIAKVRELAREAGVSKSRIRDLVSAVRDYIREINAIPESHTTTIYQRLVRQVGAQGAKNITQLAEGGIIAGASGFITKGPTVLVGEGARQTFAGRGAELVQPLDDRGIDIIAEALSRAIDPMPGRGRGGGGMIGGHATFVFQFPWAEMTKTISNIQRRNTLLIGGRGR